MKRFTKLGIFFFLAALLAALLPNMARADIVYVTLTSPVSTEWANDPFGSIWNATVSTDIAGNNVLYDARIMCSGDLNPLVGWSVTPHSSYSIFAYSSTADNGNYNYSPAAGGTASRGAEGQAQVAYLLDQMANVTVLPPNLLGCTPDDWIQNNAYALCGAVRNIWDGLTFTPVPGSNPGVDETIQADLYTSYMTAAALITPSYTSNALWLPNPSGTPSDELSQVLFGDPMSSVIPEPSTCIVWSVLGGLGIVFGCRRRWKLA